MAKPLGQSAIRKWPTSGLMGVLHFQAVEERQT